MTEEKKIKNNDSKKPSTKTASSKIKKKAAKKQKRQIMQCIIGANIVIIVGLAIYLAIFLSGSKKPDNQETVSEVSVSEETVSADELVLTEEEFIALWASTDSDLSLAKVGDIVSFGRYEQDGVEHNFLEPIEWDVLDVQDNAVLLMSHKIIDKQPYHYTLEYTTWEACSLRNWLNNDFIEKAFNDAEKEKIKTTNIENPDSFDFYAPYYKEYNMQCGALGGNPTEDKVFLLSYEELINYFELTPSENMIGYVSDKLIAEATVVTEMDTRGYTSWWLRSPADNFQFAMYVSADYLQPISGGVDDTTVGIRPVMWVTY